MVDPTTTTHSPSPHDNEAPDSSTPDSSTPDSGPTDSSTTDSSTTRRGMLGLMTLGLGAIPVVGGLFVALRSGLASARSDKPERLPLCKLGEVPEKGILEKAINFKMRRGPAVESISRVVFVTRDPNGGEILCMSGECTHLSCPVQKKEVKLEKGGDAPLACPCHGGKFSTTGEPLEGPPRRPLRRLKLELPADKKPGSMIWLLEV